MSAENSGNIPREAGKTSFDLVDPDLLFAEMGLEEGQSLLDLGCGPGRYALEAAQRLGPKGKVLALDLWPRGIGMLEEEAARQGLANIEARVADITSPDLDLKAGFDLVLMATVLHDLVERNQERGALDNAARALRPEGKLALVEFVKKDGRPGPPKPVRLSPDQVAELARPRGLVPVETVELNRHLYLSLLKKK